LSVRTFQRLQ